MSLQVQSALNIHFSCGLPLRLPLRSPQSPWSPSSRDPPCRWPVRQSSGGFHSHATQKLVALEWKIHESSVWVKIIFNQQDWSPKIWDDETPRISRTEGLQTLLTRSEDTAWHISDLHEADRQVETAMFHDVPNDRDQHGLEGFFVTLLLLWLLQMIKLEIILNHQHHLFLDGSFAVCPQLFPG